MNKKIFLMVFICLAVLSLSVVSAKDFVVNKRICKDEMEKIKNENKGGLSNNMDLSL